MPRNADLGSELALRTALRGRWHRCAALIAGACWLIACSWQAPSEGRVFGADGARTRLDGGLRDGSSGPFVLGDFDPQDGLVLHYRFNESSGSVAHDFAGEQDALIYGEARWVSSGRIGGALQLIAAPDAGTSDYVDLPPDILSGISACTIATWFNWAGNNPWERVFDFGNGLPVWIYFTPSDGTGQPRVAGRLPDPLGIFVELPVPRTVRVGTWTHLAITWTAQMIKVYLDGQLGAQIMPREGVLPNDLGSTHRNWIGKSQFQPGEHEEGYVDPDFTGLVDEFRIYDRALSDREVTALYDLE